MKGQTAFRQKLIEIFDHAAIQNPSYSLRAYSKRLKVSHSALSEFFRGKRNFSLKKIREILGRLSMDPSERDKLLKAMGEDENETNRSPHQMLATEQYRLISEWFHFVILSLLETRGAQSEASWIARRLGLPIRDVENAVHRLIEMGFLKQTSTGKLTLKKINLTTSDDIRTTALQNAHARNLDLARRSLECDDVRERDFTSLTLAFDSKKIGEAKTLIREFQDRFESLTNSHQKNEVYKLCIQFFPLTRKDPL